MRTCSSCGGTMKKGMYGDECIVCGANGARPEPAPCVHGRLVAGQNRCFVPQEKRAEVVETLITDGCPMNITCPGFEQNADFERFADRFARISLGRDYSFEDKEILDVSQTLVATRLGKTVDELTDGEWKSVAHVYDGIQKQGQGLLQTIKNIIMQRGIEHWCAFLEDGTCTQPLFGYEHGDAEWDVSKVRKVDFGPCPFVGDWAAQSQCDIARPDPRIPKDRAGLIDREAERQVTSAWSDVRSKAVRIRKDGGVTLLRNDKDVILARVKGDHGTYDVVIYRQESDRGLSVTTWECSCRWGDWSFNRVRYFGRLCSHGYAALMEAQAELMRGPGAGVWQHKFAEVSMEECAYCGSTDGLLDDPEVAGSVCGDCREDIISLAAATTLRSGTLGPSYKTLVAYLGKSADDYLADFSAPATFEVGGRPVRVMSYSDDSRFAYVATETHQSLVPRKSLIVVSQELNPLRDEIQSAIEREIGESVSAVTVRFSPHWSKRIEGDFSVNDKTHSYEYTQSTGRLVVIDRQAAPFDGKMVQPMVYGDDLDDLREMIAAENPDFAEFSKEATRQFSYSEQDALIREGEGSLARNLDGLRTDRLPDDEMDDSAFFL